MRLKDKENSITVIGLGFVGLTTALGFADIGFRVYGIEKNAERANCINAGQLPFFEPGLDNAIKALIGSNFTVYDIYDSVLDSKYVFFCVGTPFGDDGQADLSYIFGALDSCLDVLKTSKAENRPVFIIKSTVPPSTTFGRIKKYIEEKGFVVGKDLYLANNPEFLREGYAWEDFTKPDRIVIGCDDDYVATAMAELYAPFNTPIHFVTGNTAEFIKYVSNATLATLISFSNEMAELAETIGDIETSQAFRILHEDGRWHNGKMSTYLYPGCGYGGYCLPKDTTALSRFAKTKGMDTAILNEVINRNETMPHSVAERITKHADKDGTIGILGLSFKPSSDDVRESSSAKIILELIKLGYRHFVVYDPVANDVFAKTYRLNAEIDYAKNMNEVMAKGNPVVILTAWDEFRSLKNVETKIQVLDYRYML